MDIVTDRLRLRLLQAGDATWLAREISKPEVHQWLVPVPYPYTQADADAFIDRVSGETSHRLIEQGGEPLGVITIALGPDERFHLGYWLAIDAHGQGIMTEAATAMLDWQFEQGTPEVLSGWITGNASSRNVLKKLGFIDDGSKRTHAAFHGKDVTVEKVLMTADRWQTLRRLR